MRITLGEPQLGPHHVQRKWTVVTHDCPTHPFESPTNSGLVYPTYPSVAASDTKRGKWDRACILAAHDSQNELKVKTYQDPIPISDCMSLCQVYGTSLYYIGGSFHFISYHIISWYSEVMWYVYAFAIWYRLAPLPGQGSAIPMVCNNEVPLWLANVLDSQCKERYWTLQVAVQLLPWLGHAHWTPQDNDSLSANLARLHPAERQKHPAHTPESCNTRLR